MDLGSAHLQLLDQGLGLGKDMVRRLVLNDVLLVCWFQGEWKLVAQGLAFVLDGLLG